MLQKSEKVFPKEIQLLQAQRGTNVLLLLNLLRGAALIGFIS
jgi:hypothetical protein